MEEEEEEEDDDDDDDDDDGGEIEEREDEKLSWGASSLSAVRVDGSDKSPSVCCGWMADSLSAERDE